MSSQVSFEVEHTRPVAVVCPHGVLDAYTAADLRAVLMDCLVEQPTGVVLDTSRLMIADDLGLTVLAGVARESMHWPGSRFIVAGGPGVGAAIAKLGVDRFVTLCGDRSEGLAVLYATPAPPSRRDRMRPDRYAPGLARLAVQEFCQDQKVEGDGDAAQLVASELVTNAVVHAGTAIELTLRLVRPLLHIAVRDYESAQARITSILDESESTGRGLLLVDALSTAWGNLVPNTGKVVWATVPVLPAA